MQEQAFGLAVNMLAQAPTADIRAPGFNTHLQFPTPTSCQCLSWRAEGYAGDLD